MCLLIVLASLGVSTVNFADVLPLPDGQGYLLIRVQTNPRERIKHFFMADFESEAVVTMRIDDFLDMGSSAWMAVVPAPKGRYFLSTYEPFYDKGTPVGRNLNQIHRRFAPDSADETFEIAAGVINYVGDWKMRLIPTKRNSLNPVVTYDVSTLERFATDNLELANSLPIHISRMGEASISLEELAEQAETE